VKEQIHSVVRPVRDQWAGRKPVKEQTHSVVRPFDGQHGMKKRSMHCIALLSLTVLILIGCATPGGLIGETPGERFRRAIATHERYCSTHRMAPGETTCDILKLKAPDPLATPEGRFAHSIKLPSPHDKLGEVYRAGMTSEEYFKALCDAEAGEFIFKTVENVWGIVQMRPRGRSTDDMLQHLYAIEDPYGYSDWEASNPESFYVGPSSYQFIERPSAIGESKGKIARYYGYDGRNVNSMKIEASNSSRSKYGFTWRGISRSYDRELGIAGGELIVMDIDLGEILAVKRGFVRTDHARNVSTGIWWLGGEICPGDSSTLYSMGEFVKRVLKPAH
jgi:hypothetical protein